MKHPTSILQRFIESWPGQKTFGVYRFLPLFFGLGAALEFSMIKWTVGQTNFYHTFKQRRAKEIVAERLASGQAKLSAQ